MIQPGLFDADEDDVFAALVRQLAIAEFVQRRQPSLTLAGEIGQLRWQVQAISGVNLYA